MKHVANPSAAVLQWVKDSIGAGASIQSVQHLAGATSAVLHRLVVRQNGVTHRLVLRQLVDREWLAEEPDILEHEAAAIELASQVSEAVPQLVALDPQGVVCGAPVLLMTEVPGRVDLLPADMDDWLTQQAESLLPFHAVEADAFPWYYRPYNQLDTLQVPEWSAVPELWERTIEIVNGVRPDTRQCFIHRDYHPTNVLWQDGRLSGVVDWLNGCYGAPNIDVAWCRGNLSCMFGVEAADRFLQAYQSVAGAAFEYHPFWDLIVTIEVLPESPTVYRPWLDFGMTGLTDELMRERVDAYLASVLARF
jgi:aminoglycoside phosphotransferase (APT) family kinase protein